MWVLIFAFVLVEACHDLPARPVIPCDGLRDGAVMRTEHLTVDISLCPLNDTMLLYYDAYPIVNETLYFTNNVTFSLSLFRMDYALTKSEVMLPDWVDVEEGIAGTIDVWISFDGIGTMRVTHEIVNATAPTIWDVSHPEALDVRFDWKGINGSLVLGEVVASESRMWWCDPGIDPLFGIKVRDRDSRWTEGPIEVYFTDYRQNGDYLFPMSSSGNLTLRPVMDCQCWGWTCDDRIVRVCNKTEAQNYRDNPPKERRSCFDDYDGGGSIADDESGVPWLFWVWLSVMGVVLFGAIGWMYVRYKRKRELFQQQLDNEAL